MAQNESRSKAPVLEDYPVVPPAGSANGGRRAKPGTDTSTSVASLVSIVTIVRDGVKTLPRTLASVLSQDYPNIEYIIIDGASTDGTLDLLRANEHRIDLWVSAQDQGISDAFNRGIALSRGEIIGLLNSDDWYEPDAVQAAVDLMRQASADIVCGRLQYWDGDRPTYLAASDPAQLDRGMTVGHPTVFVRRDGYCRMGLFRLDFRLAMDYEWLLRAREAGARFAVVDQRLANMQGGGVGDRRWRDSQREVARARAMHIRGAASALAVHGFVVRKIFMGSVRRLLDATGLGALRRAYHRWLSPVSVTSDRHDRSS